MNGSRDVVVVGGGAVGVCCAYFLNRAGCRVTLIERGDGNDGASHGNAGMLVPSHVVPLAAPGVIGQGLRWLFKSDSPLYIRPRLDVELLRWLWRFRASCTDAHVRRAVPLLRDLLLASVDLFRELSRLDGVEPHMHEEGILMLYDSKSGAHHGAEHAEILSTAGLQVEVLGAQALHELEPALRTSAIGGVYFRQDCHVDPSSFVRTLTAYVRGRGVRFLSSTEVEGFERRGGRLHSVHAGGDRISAESFVLAAGAFSQALAAKLGVRIPVQPGRGYSLTLPRGSCSLRIPLLLHEARATVTPMGDRLRFTGALELTGLDRSIDPRRLRRIFEQVSAYLPETDTDAILAATGRDSAGPRVWSGFRPCSPDGLPIIGRVGSVPNLTVATGHGTLGLALAPITGKLVASLVSDEAPALALDLLAPGRFA